ncbi:uncharacterized protein LOC144197115 isoform X3 [Stigmatopora nigra]
MSTKRKSYSAAFKLQVVNYANENSNRAAGKTFGVSEKLVRDWRKAEVSLNAMDKSKKANRGNKARWPQLEKQLSAWLMEQLSAGIFLSTAQLRIQAAEVAREMNITEFAGGPSWCYRFMHRNHLCLEKVTLLRCPGAASDLQSEDHNFRIKQDEALQLIKKEKEELECSTQNDHFPPLLEAPPTEENNDNATAFLPEYEENLPSEPESLFAPLSEADFKSSGSSETYDSDDDDRHVARKDARRAAAMTIRKDAAVPSTGETHQLVQSGHLGQIVTVTFENGQEEDDNAKPRRDFDDFNCPQCEKTFYSKKGLKNHMSTHAPEVKIAPPAARKYFLKDFIKQEDDDDEFAVPSNLCDGVEAKKKAQNVKDTDFQCSVCQQIFESKTALKGHLRQHTNEPTLTCQFCEQKFTRKHNLKKHLRLHMPDKDSWRNQFKIQDSICPQCGKMFDNGSKMLHHMAKCKRLACKICGKRFSRKHNLMNHTMQKHNGENATENPASADGPSSSKSYRRGQNGEERRSGLDAGECSGVDGGAEERRQLILKTKMETIGRSKAGPPTSDSDRDLAQRVSSSSSQRKKKAKVNKKKSVKKGRIRPPRIPQAEAVPPPPAVWKPAANRCLICDKTYVSIGGLRRHMVKHTGSKAFACCVCDKRFGLQEYLTRHMMTHSARRCPICGERFATRVQMEVHLGTHDRPPENKDDEERNGDQSPSDKT